MILPSVKQRNREDANSSEIWRHLIAIVLISVELFSIYFCLLLFSFSAFHLLLWKENVDKYICFFGQTYYYLFLVIPTIIVLVKESIAYLLLS